MGFQADMRAAAVTFLTDYAADADVKMQVYPARPASINPPTGFVDLIRASINHETNLTTSLTAVDIIVIHGIWDSKEAADQKDAFVDGLIDWAEGRYHQAGNDSMVGISETEDLPNYIPEWMPPERQKVYYATRITLEGGRGI